MSHGHLVEETDFFSHCYPKDKGEHKEKEGLSSQSKRQKASVFLCHSLISHPYPYLLLLSCQVFLFFSSSLSVKIQLHWRERERERQRERKEAKRNVLASFGAEQNYLPYGKQSHLNPFPEANSESIHVAISLYQFLRLQLIFSVAALLLLTKLLF